MNGHNTSSPDGTEGFSTFTNNKEVYNQATVQNVGGSIHYGPIYNTQYTGAQQAHQAEVPVLLGKLDPQVQRQRILEALKFNRMESRHETIKNAHGKTCQWLLHKTEFRNWLRDDLDEHRDFLWIKGKPATGKSTVMKYLVAHAKRTMAHVHLICFFFNARGSSLEKSTSGMYRSILVQLIEAMPDLRSVLDKCSAPSTADGGTDNYHWTIDLLEQLLCDVVERLNNREAICFIDALDECDEDEARDMVYLFEQLGETAVSRGFKFRICFSSRHFPHITINNSLTFNLEDQDGHHDDLVAYLASELRIGRNDRAAQIRSEILRRASGIFLWAVLTVRILNKEYDRGRVHALKQRLNQIPDSLDALFQDILTRDGPPDDELVTCLRWVLYARQPLSLEELYHAIITETDDEIIDDDGDDRDDPDAQNEDETTRDIMSRFVLHCSKGLIEETKTKPKFVQFIHESVRDYLFKGGPLAHVFGSSDDFTARSHEKLKQGCHNYYIKANIETRLAVPDALPTVSWLEVIAARQNYSKRFPFLTYAVRNMLYHGEMAGTLGLPQKHFIQELDLRLWNYYNDLVHPATGRRFGVNNDLLDILVEQELPHLISVAIGHIAASAMTQARFSSILLAASVKGNKSVVHALLSPHTFIGTKNHTDTGTISEDRVQKAVTALLEWVQIEGIVEPRYPFVWACSRGEVELVQCLLAHEQVDFGSNAHLPIDDGIQRRVKKTFKDVGSPLHVATLNGHAEVVRLLLRGKNVDVNACGSYMAPLQLATCYGHVEVIRVLLQQPGIKLDEPDRDGWTPFEMASVNGQPEIAAMLRAHGGAPPSESRSNSPEAESPVSIATTDYELI